MYPDESTATDGGADDDVPIPLRTPRTPQRRGTDRASIFTLAELEAIHRARIIERRVKLALAVLVLAGAALVLALI